MTPPLLASAVEPDLTDPEFVRNVPKTVTHLMGFAPCYARHGEWVFYGSQPTGNSCPGSDLDCLLIHDNPQHLPERIGAEWNGTPVTIYALSRSALTEDVDTQRYGGYFALKLFRPWISASPEPVPQLESAAARFLGPFATRVAVSLGHVDQAWTAPQVLAHAHLAFTHLYPHSLSYYARTLDQPPLHAKLWNYQLRTFVPSLAAAGWIENVGNHWRYCHPERRATDRLAASCAARFWAFGAVSHGSDFSFPDQYFTHADDRCPLHVQHTALTQLRGLAGAV